MPISKILPTQFQSSEQKIKKKIRSSDLPKWTADMPMSMQSDSFKRVEKALEIKMKEAKQSRIVDLIKSLSDEDSDKLFDLYDYDDLLEMGVKEVQDIINKIENTDDAQLDPEVPFVYFDSSDWWKPTTEDKRKHEESWKKKNKENLESVKKKNDFLKDYFK